MIAPAQLGGNYRLAPLRDSRPHCIRLLLQDTIVNIQDNAPPGKAHGSRRRAPHNKRSDHHCNSSRSRARTSGSPRSAARTFGQPSCTKAPSSARWSCGSHQDAGTRCPSAAPRWRTKVWIVASRETGRRAAFTARYRARSTAGGATPTTAQSSSTVCLLTPPSVSAMLDSASSSRSAAACAPRRLASRRCPLEGRRGCPLPVPARARARQPYLERGAPLRPAGARATGHVGRAARSDTGWRRPLPRRRHSGYASPLPRPVPAPRARGGICRSPPRRDDLRSQRPARQARDPARRGERDGRSDRAFTGSLS
jgi:hypothetical protein